MKGRDNKGRKGKGGRGGEEREGGREGKGKGGEERGRKGTGRKVKGKVKGLQPPKFGTLSSPLSVMTTKFAKAFSFANSRLLSCSSLICY